MLGVRFTSAARSNNPTHSFNPSFDIHLLNTSCMPGTKLDAEDTRINKTRRSAFSTDPSQYYGGVGAGTIIPTLQFSHFLKSHVWEAQTLVPRWSNSKSQFTTHYSTLSHGVSVWTSFTVRHLALGRFHLQATHKVQMPILVGLRVNVPPQEADEKNFIHMERNTHRKQHRLRPPPRQPGNGKM